VPVAAVVGGGTRTVLEGLCMSYIAALSLSITTATATNTLPIGERGLTVETTGMAWWLREAATQERVMTAMEPPTRLIAVPDTSLGRKWDQPSSVGGSILGTVCSWTVVAAMRW